MELPFDIKFKTKWQKALLYSLIYYIISLILLNVAIVFEREEFNIKLLAIISISYMAVSIIGFRYMYKKFEEKFQSSNN